MGIDALASILPNPSSLVTNTSPDSMIDHAKMKYFLEGIEQPNNIQKERKNKNVIDN